MILKLQDSGKDKKMDQKMDKEMQAKVEEFVKSYGKRGLSLDELDKVVGGAGECFNAQDIRTDEERAQLIDLAYAMTDSYGFDVALEAFMEITGYTTYRAGVTGGGTDRDKMGVVLNGYFTMLDAGGGYH